MDVNERGSVCGGMGYQVAGATMNFTVCFDVSSK